MPGACMQHVLRDGLQQVRLAEPRVAVDHERVVGLAGRLGDRQCGGVREAVGAADHERAERVLRAQRLGGLGAARALGRLRPRGGRSRSDLRLGARPLVRVLADEEAHRHARIGRDGGLAHQLGEMALDPRAGELVGDADLEHVALERERAGRREPRTEDHRREVVADAVGDRGPQQIRMRWILLAWQRTSTAQAGIDRRRADGARGADASGSRLAAGPQAPSENPLVADTLAISTASSTGPRPRGRPAMPPGDSDPATCPAGSAAAVLHTLRAVRRSACATRCPRGGYTAPSPSRRTDEPT